MPMGIRDLAMESRSLGGAGGAQIGTFGSQTTVRVSPGQRLDIFNPHAWGVTVTTRSGQSTALSSNGQGLSVLGKDFQSATLQTTDAGALWAIVSPDSPFTFPGVPSTLLRTVVLDPTSGLAYPVYFTPVSTQNLTIPASGVLRGIFFPTAAGTCFLVYDGSDIYLGKATPNDISGGTGQIEFAIAVQTGKLISCSTNGYCLAGVITPS